MPWLKFFTIVAQVCISLALIFFAAAVISVIYNNFRDKN